ncbi:hypothetical protein [Guptibacillus hwajinpoensis]|uniref:Dimethylamine monooxygenase subunit DmmA-like C-terminal domain-containing protein n=1 Tax=Guptibacillus hwajinpoensis TaxID=208199 RepID=A0ABU0JXJ8_9BACL|nr:hypothetical protein [Alkalihalobacillus hemicentroti]MDQ0481819.1 hypothetical protein [Alkalihalobacillus hemicentroti]
MTEFQNYKRVLVFTDQRYFFQANDKVRELTKEGYRCEVVSMPISPNKAEQLLSQQPLGSVVWIYGEENSSQAIEYVARNAGFSKNEIWINKSSEQNTRIFCSQCHHINEISSAEMFECERCHIKLDPSNHYSIYHKSYLAYPIIN